ncbi:MULTISPECIES: SRPBCC domain-containing protein [unclassified Cryobacterium]|uniref:SRPBCC domain-containing protein n=1 Tax=unclassified Cryobacterium TaxID=2649013 RepID=UPI002AB4044F|nr:MULTISPECIES: SRPBCC domain-containing protein [unclassified Cryobacterium]MDY7541327.1 SRPBCC domain-containing protein [Cryobacterium sp. 5B3]MEA9998127.1 SRPBCC domain-containing protein [Cryobacterium sp. RTS3]MEB0265317.1 SRPBCC domain-containing protein [Cryobacterium sp. 10I5]MEB0273374.1 SRPBCC domain-containing protein [Cryobacterium sp. 5B3]
MKFFEARSTITATPEHVWGVLSDAGGWPSWDSGVESVDGTVMMGETLRIRSKVAPGRTFPVTVITLTRPSQLVFRSGMPLGLFRGTRTYTLRSLSPSETEFVMREEYTGPLAGLIGRSIPDLAPSFQQFANGLKERVEQGS